MSATPQEVLQQTGLVDWSVFSELIAIMDEDEDGLALSLFQEFVTQFEETSVEIDANLKQGRLDELSKLGHYIKGSAAALGLVKISHQCERIQNYGNKHNFDHARVVQGKVIAPESGDGDGAAGDGTSATSGANSVSDGANSADGADGASGTQGAAGASADGDGDGDDLSDGDYLALVGDATARAKEAFAASRTALSAYFGEEL
ncbi:hypothetical protein DIURU_004010 [Diutina rugosa]|uniref:HPt domain-containing protein n=1 Tax=Diutina rugosa TaxID=5481 RepID=A0A642UIX9_DIURU|nr:uncharacterized protein DIURU_004010 [Diutina rugosa]KAA8899969.1 hypothetical protein DIURU_004010 [Diutina rugosa]